MDHDYELERYYNTGVDEPEFSDYECTESIHEAYEELEYIKMCEASINY